MKTVSTIMPERAIKIERKSNRMCDVILITNVQSREVKNEFDDSTVEMWEYDMYRETMPYRDNLESVIENDLANWIVWAEHMETERKMEKTTEEILQELQERQLDNTEVNVDQEVRIALLELGLEGGE